MTWASLFDFVLRYCLEPSVFFSAELEVSFLLFAWFSVNCLLLQSLALDSFLLLSLDASLLVVSALCAFLLLLPALRFSLDSLIEDLFFLKQPFNRSNFYKLHQLL